MQMHSRPNLAVLTLALMLPIAACEDVTAPGGESGMGTANVVLAGSGPGSAAGLANLVSASLVGPVELGVVASIDVTLSAVQAHRNAEAEDDDAMGWYTLELTAPVEIDLMALPLGGEEDAGLEIAQGELPVGTYRNLRLMFSEATITFAEDVQFAGGPAGMVYEAGVSYPLFIPSGAQTGIKIPLAGFDIEEGEGDTVVITFDATASVQNVNVTGNGILMTPVLREKANGV